MGSPIRRALRLGLFVTPILLFCRALFAGCLSLFKVVFLKSFFCFRDSFRVFSILVFLRLFWGGFDSLVFWLFVVAFLGFFLGCFLSFCFRALVGAFHPF